ncbi:hypothetical protein BKA82DRAFT_1000598 [Pisolithus tinctorius]|uniref:YCII-related domain-containing protein n=1 Tax=Pisolithus tinctorius Marx 270 TaxID=870435 RepID=A0A0C3K4I9_PISTI|nr:hypothetical protein BKA82DRAFT_1000598 [Pisolithus tinctorius]KIO04482.1 hypothetical protein M404DRAFT_1000598 [Pisolithus tinctorius Marx 270]
MRLMTYPVGRRHFTASAQRQQTYIVWAPDNTDEGALARRMAVRQKHFVAANKLIKQGILKVAGGLLTPDTQDAAPGNRRFVGSALLYEAENLDAVRKFVEQDLYWTENVWDKDKIVILPIIMATTLQERAGIT